jgi:hypothetical protein
MKDSFSRLDRLILNDLCHQIGERYRQIIRPWEPKRDRQARLRIRVHEKDFLSFHGQPDTQVFTSGQNELTLTNKDGDTKTVYHYGYVNYTGFMKEVMPYIGTPEALVISGSSAGGFATSLLSDDIITNYFPDTEILRPV